MLKPANDCKPPRSTDARRRDLHGARCIARIGASGSGNGSEAGLGGCRRFEFGQASVCDSGYGPGSGGCEEIHAGACHGARIAGIGIVVGDDLAVARRRGWRVLVRLGVTLMALLLAGAVLATHRARGRRHAYRLSERRRMLAERASQAKTRFLADLGHEIRTPMTGVLGLSELLLASDLSPRQRAQVQAIRRAGEHLQRLVDDALDLARVEAGRLELQPGDFDPHLLVEEVAELMAAPAGRRGLRFTSATAAEVPRWVHGDRRRIAQILMNLTANAIKFTERGFVGVQAAVPQPGMLRFSVIDSGPGLSAAQQRRIFHRFEQADGARTAARFGGSGLGLAISRELAVAMGGRIRVRSLPGVGTRFDVDLPLPWAPPPPSNDAMAVSDPLRLLLVESDAGAASVLAGLLRAQGHRVTHAGHGLAALTEVAVQAFDGVLLDLDLPGFSGLALAAQLRRQGFPWLLLAVTARTDARAEPEALAVGCDGFVRKPLTGRMLADALQRAQAAAARRGARAAF